MIIGIPAEVKDHEYRVGVTPDGVRELVRRGHEARVETDAGLLAGYPDEEYANAGAEIVDIAEHIWEDSDLVVKVKEPVTDEFRHLRPGLMLFTYLHLADNPGLTQALLDTRVTAIAYETILDERGRLPLLAPMSEIAGRMAAQVGATYLERARGGCGVLIGGAVGVDPARVVVLGAGMAGSSAARVAAGMGADVVVIDNDADRLRDVDRWLLGRVRCAPSSTISIEHHVREAHVVVGAALNVGARAPHLVEESVVRGMRPGSVIVDVSIDQGGCVETSRMTTHSAPTFLKHDVVHYCVGNMPGAVPATSTIALTNATLPYVLRLVEGGLGGVLDDPGFANGLNCRDGDLILAS